jgi:tRNA (uracil-5-)-methyltransferase TRM9
MDITMSSHSKSTVNENIKEMNSWEKMVNSVQEWLEHNQVTVEEDNSDEEDKTVDELCDELTEKLYVECVYNDIAKHFDNTRAYVWSWVFDFVSKYCLKGVIYDIGCGNGRNSLVLKEKNIEHTSSFICVDNSEKLLEICKEKNLSTIEGNITELPIEDSTADNILCIAVLHHLASKKRQQKALHELYRILKEGGKCLLSVWSINQPKKIKRRFQYGENIVKWNKFGNEYDRFYYIFKVEELTDMILKSGFSIEQHFWDCGNEVFVLVK